MDHIDLMALEARSTSPPLDVEEVERDATPGVREQKPPEEVCDLAIEEVRMAALKNNLDVKVELVGPSIAEEVFQEEAARFEATFFASAARRKADPPAVSLGDDTELVSTTHDFGIRIPLETGGSIQVDIPLATENDSALGASSVYESDVRFSIRQPLLRDGGVAVNTAPIIMAQLAQGQARSRTKLAAIRILADAERAYWDHYAAGRVLEIRYEQYKLAVEQRDQAQRLADKAVVPKVEVLRSEAGVVRRVEAIIVAETRRLATERNLKRIMNAQDLPLEGPTTLLPKTRPRPLRLTLDAASLAEQAVVERMEMMELELQLTIDALTIDVARNATLPLLNVDYSHSLRGGGANLDRSVDNLSTGRFGDWDVGIVLEVPLGNRAAKARLRRALLDRILSSSTRAQRRLGIVQEVYNAVDEFEENWQRILTARREKKLAEKVYAAEQRQFRAGVRTSTEVLEAVAFLARAKIREIEALTGYEIAKVQIALTTGTLLGRGRVHLTPYVAPHRSKTGATALEN